MERIVRPGGGAGEVVVHEFGSGGPLLVVLAGVHGDEFEGRVAVRVLRDRLAHAPLRGRVRLVAEAHPAACGARTRTSPLDGLNLAREFPGDPAGPPTRRLAAALADEVLAGADLVVDLHSAGTTFDMPLFAGVHADGGEVALAAGRAFGAPLLWVHDAYAPGRTISTAHDRGVPTLYVEGCGGGGLRGDELDTHVGGVLACASALGILPPAASPPPPPRVLRGGTGDLDHALLATAPGWTVTRSRAGAEVGSGDLLAEVVADDGTVAQRVTSTVDGLVMLLRRLAPTEPGDTLAMVAPAAMVEP